MPKLLINEGGQASVFELFDDEATIGRGASNAVQIEDAHASKHHAVVRRHAGRVKMVDLESKNGTRVNGEFRNQRWLQHGDAVSIGAAVLTYDASDAVAAPAAAPVVVRAGGGGDALAATLPSSVLSSVAAPMSRAARSRARSRDDDDDDDRPRRSSRRSGNSTGVVLLVGGGLIAVVALFVLLLAGKGLAPNTKALRAARDLSMRGTKADVQAALDYLVQYGDPADVDTYVSVTKQIAELKDKLIAFDETVVEEAANKDIKAIERAWIEMHKNGKTEADIGRDLIKWVATYQYIGSGPGKIPCRAVAAFLSGRSDKKFLNVYLKAKNGGDVPPPK